MSLINLQTDLKSLKFGKDRPGGGSSKQPYIQKPISDNPQGNTGGTDFILRGGLKAPQRALEDVARLTKYIADGSKGILYTAKENLLSRMSVGTEASKGPAYAMGALNAGVYTPLSTLAQAGVGFAGTHLNKMGIDPTGLSLNKYEDIVKKNNFEKTNSLTLVKGGNLNLPGSPNPTFIPDSLDGVVTNRLLTIYKDKQFTFSLNNNTILEYGGGPGSILGVGKTRIKFADQRTGQNNVNLAKSEFFSEGFKVFKDPRKGPRTFNTINLLKGITNNQNYPNKTIITFNDPNGDFNIGNAETTISKYDLGQGPGKIDEGIKNTGFSGEFSIFKDPRDGSRTFNTTNLLKGITSEPIYNLPNQTFYINNGENVKDIFKYNPSSTEDFNLYEESKISKFLTPEEPKIQYPYPPTQPNGEPSYTAKFETTYAASSNFLNKPRIETRLNLGDPGAQKGKWAADHTEPKTAVLDKINGSRIYLSQSPGKRHEDFNDIIAFRIGIIDSNTPTNNLTYMNFRSYIDSFSDSYSSDWKAQSYMGRGEKFYKYGGFDRSISMAFTVVAQSQAEMNGMYQKLNFLASSLAPTYTSNGYMAGNLVKMTVGNYIYEQYGFISSINYDIPQESSWELSLTPGIGIAGKDVKPSPNPDELPFMIKVTGLKFTPIHNFRPEINTYNNAGKAISENRFITEQIPFTPNHNNY